MPIATKPCIEQAWAAGGLQQSGFPSTQGTSQNVPSLPSPVWESVFVPYLLIKRMWKYNDRLVLGTACKQFIHNFEKFIRRKCVYCLGQSKRRRHAGCATVQGGHIQRELECQHSLHPSPSASCQLTLLSRQAVDTLCLCKQPKPRLPRISGTHILK